MREMTIGQNEGGQRIDKFLSKRFKTMPQALVYKFLRTKRIKLNGKKAAPGDFVETGDVLKVDSLELLPYPYKRDVAEVVKKKKK